MHRMGARNQLRSRPSSTAISQPLAPLSRMENHASLVAAVIPRLRRARCALRSAGFPTTSPHRPTEISVIKEAPACLKADEGGGRLRFIRVRIIGRAQLMSFTPQSDIHNFAAL